MFRAAVEHYNFILKDMMKAVLLQREGGSKYETYIPNPKPVDRIKDNHLHEE